MPAPNTGMARTVTRVGKGNSMIKDRSPNKTPRRRRPLSAAGLSATTVVLPLRLCWVLGVAHFGSLLCAGVQAPNTSPWLLRASALQRFLTYDMPLDQVPMVATHNSFNTEEEGVSTTWEVVPNQVFSITQQLTCLGVRGLELDVHFVEELLTGGTPEEDASLVCHARPSTALEIQQTCSAMKWYLCEAIGLYDYGDDTGCSSTAPTLREAFEEISAWLALPENAEELLFIKMETFVGTDVKFLPDYIAEVFGADTIFGPLDFMVWERTSGSAGWPSTEYLVSAGKRLVFASTSYQNVNIMFKISRDNDEDSVFHEDTTSVENFRTIEPCSSRTRKPSWSRVQGDASTWEVNYSGLTVFELIPASTEFLAEADVGKILTCGLIPTFDRMDSTLLEATMWSWAEGEPHAYFSSPRAAMVNRATGRWTSRSTADNEEDGGEIHSFACRDDGSNDRGEWVVSKGAAGYFSAAEPVCRAQGLVFGCPRTAGENAALRVAMAQAYVSTAWVNLRSSGGGDASTWARESGVPYTLSATYTHATCDNGGYSAAVSNTWGAEDAWVYGDSAFYEKAERIKGEAQALRDKAEALVLVTEGQGISSDEENAAGIAELNSLTAGALLKQAEWVENAAREAGAYPKGW
ncbi:unnamed protein product [Pylaiella littoralis]